MTQEKMLHIGLLPVYSRLAETIPQALQMALPCDLHLSKHQVETYQALTGEADVIFNVALTGDGKSLAGQLPLLVHSRPTMAMYPTNELISDQSRQSKASLQRWNREDLGVTHIDARQLDEFQEETELRRADAMLNRWRNHQLVLTNPDIFHYVMQQYYIHSGEAPDRIIGPLLDLFEQFIFDEFHVFQAPQIVAVLNALLFIRQVAGQRAAKCLFLSATPSAMMLRALTQAGLRTVQINGDYTHTRQQPDPTQWRRILHGCTLGFAPQGIEAWLEQHLHDVVMPFFLTHKPAAKGAVIVNSVASAQRLVSHIKPLFASHGLTVESNTGFDTAQRRQGSYSADLLIGTSTVDVGVDFQINFLVFESHDAGSFLQRFGRLGRHDGFPHDGQWHRFEHFAAYALLPPWLCERLFQAEAGTAPPLTDAMEIDRDSFSQVIREAFPPTATFEAYGKVWGGLQAASILRGLYHPTIKSQFAGTRERLAQQYTQVLGVSIGQQLHRLRELEQVHRPIADEARSFRGGGELACGILDEQESDANRVKTYELFGLLANFELAPLGKEAFLQEVHRRSLPRKVYEADTIAAYFRVLGVRAERNDLRILFNEDLTDWGPENFGVTQVVQHIEIDGDNIPELFRLNQGLKRRHQVALLCLSMHPAELARRLRLPWPFPLYRFQSRDNKEGCIAFGRQALLLEVALQRRPDIACGGVRPTMIV